jgi:hypothetical protein
MPFSLYLFLGGCFGSLALVAFIGWLVERSVLRSINNPKTSQNK